METSIKLRLARVCPTLAPRLSPDVPLIACGLDSLEFVELLCAIESEFQVRLSVDDLTPETTARNLFDLITNRMIR
ncbi:acyl carrier protein [Rariglobus hedericola]|uniref:Acyl carrier protein n=1 Tax=Rariglobus hedericola TaxID=2597822 RepID=A0A556QQC9_9BACT|nr:acyl carrier protein [Rariglobus hedericola]TSJ78848.1 acyl carrier protein [Rariglobus hedericola]